MVVRTDKQLGEGFSESTKWDADASELYNFIEEVEVNGETQRIVSSQSGHERNHLFMNQTDHELKDVSLVSGLDSIADGRANAIWDFDRDGFQDIVLVNANNPLLQLFHNQMKSAAPTSSNFIAVQLTGGNQTGQPTDEWSNRDGIGAVVNVQVGDTKLVREARAGEGFASQNSKVMLVGIGDQSEAEVSVDWPSGKRLDYGTVPAGQLAHCYEDKSATFNLSGIELAPYVTEDPFVEIDRVVDRGTFQLDQRNSASSDKSRLILYVTMATWCPNCKKNQPLLALLREQFGDQVELIGVPVDAEDTAAKLAEYRQKYRPAYELLDPVAAAERAELETLVTSISEQGALPSTLITDRQGRVLDAVGGIPSSSTIARLLDRLPKTGQ